MYRQVFYVEPIEIEINSDDRYEELAKIFRFCQKAEDSGTKRKIVINVHHNPCTPQTTELFYSLSETFAFNKEGYLIKGKRFSYSVKGLFDYDDDTVVDIYWKHQNAIKRELLGVANGIRPSRLDVHNKREEEVLHLAHYGCLWYIIAISLMKYDSVFVHSGIVAKNGKAVMLAGSSGCGKTSTIMDLLERDGWKYISEDFAILHKNGTVYPFPRTMAIYSSDLKFGNITLNAAIENNLTRWEKLKWKGMIKIGKEPLYHLPPQKVFAQEKLGDKAEIEKVLFLGRIPKGRTLEYEDITLPELIDRITDSSYRELKEIYEVICNIRANGDSECLKACPTLSELMDKHKKILFEGLERASIKLVRVPLNENPSNIIKNAIDG